MNSKSCKKIKSYDSSTMICDSCYYDYFYYKNSAGACISCTDAEKKNCLSISESATTCTCTSCYNADNSNATATVNFLDSGKCSACLSTCSAC